MRTGTNIILPIAAVLLLAASGASAAWNAGYALGAFGLPSFLPDDPDIALKEAVEAVPANGRMTAPPLTPRARAAAGLDPLEEEPLLLASLANTAGDHRRAIRLLSEARRRDPASSAVRILLLDRYLRTDDVAGAIGEIGALSSLLPDRRQALSELLLNLVAAPATRHRAIEALRRSPIRKPLMSQLARAGASSYLLLDLSKGMAPIAPASEDAAWAQTVLMPLVNQGDIAGAHRLWLRMFASSDTKSGSRVLDPTFAGEAAPPFGWQISSSTSGIAEQEEGGLRVRYEGRDAKVFARQLLMLEPGKYRLDYTLEAEDGPSPNLAWRIECIGGAGTILDLSFIQIYSFDGNRSPDFTVPAQDCSGQWLSLAGRPLPVPSMRSTLISRVKIAGGSRQ